MGDKLIIRLLGAIEIELAGEPVTGLGTRKAEALLAYLVSHKRPFSREQLADLLWDDRPQKQALANLRSLLSGMRRKIKPWLIVTRQTVAFNHDSPYWLDTAELEKLTRDDDAGSPTLLTLYRGDFLEGFYLRDCLGFEEWATLERERLQRLAVNALRRRAIDCLRNGRYQRGLQYTDKLLKLDDLSEQAHRLKMELLARNGQRSAALQQYAACRRILAEELGVEPAPATQALQQRLRSLSFPPPHNLPPDPAPFLGREAALDDINRKLRAPDTRLLAIVGPGGIGKTRLALQAARHIAQDQPGRFLDGVFFAPLAATQTANAIPFRLAEAIGFAFQGADAPRQQILAHLRDKEMLLLFDNLEHLLTPEDDNAAAFLADVLRETTAVTLLATSRERLNLYEEIVYAIPGLALPPDESPQPEQYSAIALFLQQARRLRHNFTPSPDEMAAIVRLCRLLDGAPLAIELAAGWSLQHSCQEIAEETAASLDFLRTTYRNVPARQRSLRAVFDHSWALLPAALQTVFARLSLFPDTFTAEAAAAVAGAAADDLAALQDKFLARQEVNGRYHIHPLLQQFAAEKLDDADGAIRQRHAAFYLDFIARQGSGESVAERAAIRAELPNVTLAWKWAARRRDYAALDQAIPTLHSFFSAQSWFHEGIDHFQFALAQMDEAANPAALSPARAQTMCDLWAHKARLHLHIGQLRHAESSLAQAAACLGQVDDPGRRSTILSYLSMTHFYAGQYEQASALLEEALQLALQADDLNGVAFAYNFLGSSAKAQGQYKQAHNYFTQALAAYRQLEDEIGAGIALHNLGNLAQATGDYDSSLDYYQQCNALFQANDYTQGAATASANAGRLALQMGNYAEAEKLLAEALTLKEAINDIRGIAVALVGLGAVAAETGELGQARAYLARSLVLAQESGDVKLLLEGVVVTAVYAHRRSQPETAAALTAFVLNHPATAQEVRQQAEKLAAGLELPADSPPQDLDGLVTTLLDGLLASE
ncbi:MAG TPA: tetratricopeptide repeat protein [Anaerolineae bacterium]|nr:tetratricopeptide repeat protein [Anaerolineae bacterium]